jgi:ABC-type multidrug transport system ATPase subunit
VPAEPESAIELEGLGRDYGERAALRDLSISVPRGATLAVLGPNGAGKSTLLRVLAGLLRPHAGTARVLGRELPREGWAVRGRVGFLSHEPLLYLDLSGRENLRYHARLHGVNGRRVDDLLERVGMKERAGEPVRTLSRGMTQWLAVCRAVLHQPEVLLLDEPLSHVDPGAAQLVGQLIGPAAGMTRVVTSHDPRGALADAELALGLRDGRVAWAGPADEVTESQIGELYR